MGPGPKGGLVLASEPEALEVAGPGNCGLDSREANTNEVRRGIAQRGGLFQNLEALPKCFMHQNAPPVRRRKLFQARPASSATSTVLTNELTMLARVAASSARMAPL